MLSLVRAHKHSVVNDWRFAIKYTTGLGYSLARRRAGEGGGLDTPQGFARVSRRIKM